MINEYHKKYFLLYFHIFLIKHNTYHFGYKKYDDLTIYSLRIIESLFKVIRIALNIGFKPYSTS